MRRQSALRGRTAALEFQRRDRWCVSTNSGTRAVFQGTRRNLSPSLSQFFSNSRLDKTEDGIHGDRCHWQQMPEERDEDDRAYHSNAGSGHSLDVLCIRRSWTDNLLCRSPGVSRWDFSDVRGYRSFDRQWQARRSGYEPARCPDSPQ